MRDKFFKKINELGILKKTKILLAVSGGVDSMVLTHLLHALNFKFSIAHCNFCLRGKESIRDENFIQSISKKINVKLFIKQFNTDNYAVNNKISIQMAARDLRYSWFEDIRKEHGFDFIATAHNYNDSVETLLINLIRGTGIAGLHGIKSKEKNIIRPIIRCYKDEIHKYAKDNNIKYCEDSSNSEDKYVRNKIRNKILPIMKEINPSIIDSIGKTILKVRDVEKLYNHMLSGKKAKLLIKNNDEYRINIKSILKELSPKQLLYELIFDFGFYDIDAVFKSLFSTSGKEFHSQAYYMIKDRTDLIISKYIMDDVVTIDKRTTHINKPFVVNFSVSLISKFEFRKKQNNKIMHMDYDRLKFPLLMRPWKKGDKFIPLGMKETKKISDYFIDNKFSLIQKKKARLLISNNKIVCVIGKRLDDRFKLVENSKKVYIVNL